jgi:hypothetical protein
MLTYAGLLEAPAESKLLETSPDSAATAQPHGGGHALGRGGGSNLATAEVPVVVASTASGKKSGMRNSAHEELLDYRVVNEVA